MTGLPPQTMVKGVGRQQQQHEGIFDTREKLVIEIYVVFFDSIINSTVKNI